MSLYIIMKIIPNNTPSPAKVKSLRNIKRLHKKNKQIIYKELKHISIKLKFEDFKVSLFN
jgi:hypothetical protein